MSENNRVPLREYLDLRFDALDEKLERLEDHEERIRALEKQSPFRTVAHIINATAAAIGIALSSRQQ